MSATGSRDGRILVVEFESSAPAGLFGEWLVDTGASLDVRRPYVGDSLPPDLTGHAAVVVLGGSANVSDADAYPWLHDVMSLLSDSVEGRTPILGICLGLQLMTVALGGEVEPNPRGQQIGVLPVGWLPTAENDQLFGTLTGLDAAVQWNKQVVRSLPPDAVVLAETARAEIQAARFGPRMWGVQWHPEVGREIAALWAEEDRDAVQERDLDIDRYVADVAEAEPRLMGWRALANRLVDLSQDLAPRSAWPG